MRLKININKAVKGSRDILTHKKGQVIVEYILLIVVSTFMALALIKLVTVDPNVGSPVFKYWERLLKNIGEDIST